MGTNNIVVGSPTATIDWSATTNDFLQAGQTQGFSSTTQSDYTVLNRITPADTANPIQLNGSVTSTVMGGATGGNIWFYSPSGIVVGANATFDVGGLLLTSLSIADGWTADANGFSASFSKQVFDGYSDGGPITNNATGAGGINASNYVAIVAPRIAQAGEIRVGESAALVAANWLTLTMNLGLFNIAVSPNGGTDDSNGIVHSGSTTGPTTGNRIYLVAVPKNQAITMLLGGTIGFDATSATELNGKVILLSGWYMDDSAGGEILQGQVGANGSIAIGGAQGAATFTSDVRAFSTTAIDVTASSGNVAFAGNVLLDSFLSSTIGSVSLNANNNRSDHGWRQPRYVCHQFGRRRDRIDHGVGRSRRFGDREYDAVCRPGGRSDGRQHSGRFAGQRFDDRPERHGQRQRL